MADITVSQRASRFAKMLAGVEKYSLAGLVHGWCESRVSDMMSHLPDIGGDTMPKQTADYAVAAFTVLYAMVAFALILATSLLTLSATTGYAASARVRSACASDYLAHCSQHAPDSPGVRKCMSAHGSQLSKSCVDALVADGEVSRSEVQRRKTASQH